MNGSHFHSGRKGIICMAVGDIAASDAIFAASKGSLNDVSLFITTQFLFKYPYNQIFDIHLFTFSYAVYLPWIFCQIHSITKYSARFLDLYFCESTAAIVPIIG